MTRSIRWGMAVLLAAASLTGCQREDAGEDALKLTGKMFIFNYRLAYATYMITLSQERPQAEGSTVVATFENPAGGAPLVLTRKLFAKLDKVVLESPDVTCVKPQTPYAVTIAVNGPEGRTVQTLETTVVSNLDQNILPAHALVVGPAYDRNPEMFKDGKTPARFETAVCPS